MLKYFIILILSMRLFALNVKALNEYVCDINTISGNAVQGIDFLNDNEIILSQTRKDKYLLFSIVNLKTKKLDTLKIEYPSHGQDLSVIFYNHQYHLFTTGKHWNGISDFIIDTNTYKIDFYKNHSLNIGKNTPTVSTSGKYFATVAHKNVYLYRFNDVITTKDSHQIFSFILSKEQLSKKQWIQGIEMKDNFIYILTGDNKLDSKKLLYIYDSYGTVYRKIVLNIGKNIAIQEGKKLELEGLAFNKNILYTTLMTGKDGKNKKRLYKVLEVSYK